jgi:hypothetical protein
VPSTIEKAAGAMQENLNSKIVEWLEKVSDEQYPR